MNSFNIINTALKFNEKINQRDIEGLAKLMTDDHTFIDNAGTVTKGKALMIKGWTDFFSNFPNTKIFLPA